MLDDQGRFWHDGQLVEKATMTRAFFKWLDRHPDDGRYILQNGYDWTYLTVQDVPFFVTTVVSRHPHAPKILLSDGSAETLDPTTLRQDGRGAVYCMVKEGRFPARMTAAAQNELSPYLVENATGEVEFQVESSRFPIGKKVPAPADEERLLRKPNG